MAGRVDARSRVLSLLAESGYLSRADLARRSTLAVSTVSAVVSELQAENLVEEQPADEGRERGAVGRPSSTLALHRHAGVVVGIDFGKRHVHAAVADFAHNILAERRTELPEDLPAAQSTDRAVQAVRKLLKEAGARRAEVRGVGMALPGPILQANGQVGDSSILPGWVGVQAAGLMGAAIEAPVLVDNDANLGALSEWLWGAGERAANMVFLKIATGIGAGLILNGAPFRGAGGTAGEIGHTVVDPRGRLCRCGNRGCLEVVAGTPAIVEAARTPLRPAVSLDDIIAGALEGDTGYRRVIADAGDQIGQALATVVNLINPTCIVVGDELGRAGEALLEPIRRSISRAAIGSAVQDAEVVPGSLGPRAVVLGAVAVALLNAAPALGEAPA